MMTPRWGNRHLWWMLIVLLLAKTFQIGVAESSDESDDSDDEHGAGSAVLTLEDEGEWWEALGATEKMDLASLFYDKWWADISKTEQISYAWVAQTFFAFLDTGEDSNALDSYQGFAPLLLRASFHSSGSFNKPSGTGGSNGGTIFNSGELEDSQNGCIDAATEQISGLLNGNRISLADSIVIGGVVALKFMDFPRMDTIKLRGGRLDYSNGICMRDRLAGPDDNAEEPFMENYGLTRDELVALIGGGHSFGAAHGKCSGYEGQWTINPLSWDNAEVYFSDLLKDDWRWYQVCTFENNIIGYTSIDDPFAGDGDPEDSDSSDDDGDDGKTCDQLESIEPLDCQSQAMRGCPFEDGKYPAGQSPCNEKLTMRLKADFFLKENAALLSSTEKFAEDGDILAETFGIAYHKLTHNGLDRCGLGGHGCVGDGIQCIDCEDEDGRILFSTCAKKQISGKSAKKSSEKSSKKSSKKGSKKGSKKSSGLCPALY